MGLSASWQLPVETQQLLHSSQERGKQGRSSPASHRHKHKARSCALKFPRQSPRPRLPSLLGLNRVAFPQLEGSFYLASLRSLRPKTTQEKNNPSFIKTP